MEEMTGWMDRWMEEDKLDARRNEDGAPKDGLEVTGAQQRSTLA